MIDEAELKRLVAECMQMQISSEIDNEIERK